MFVITNFVQFDRAGRALCPCCQSDQSKKFTKKNLSLVPGGGGAYKCHKGCTPEQIRQSLDQTLTVATPTPPPPPIRPFTTYSRGEVLGMMDRLIDDDQARAWLSKRGVTLEMVTRYNLGLMLVNGQRAISIPYQSTGGYLIKYALVDWHTGAYQFRQPGISKRIWTGYKGNGENTCLVEGEWDAIALGSLFREADSYHSVITGSNGAGTIPDGLPESGNIFVFYDHDEAGQKGAEAIKQALGERVIICQVPYIPVDGEVSMPKGYDVRDAIQRGATYTDFVEAIQNGLGFTLNAKPVRKEEQQIPSLAEELPQTNARQLQLKSLRKLYAHRLRKNLRGYQIERDGNPVNADFLYLECLEEDGIMIAKDKANDLFDFFATGNQYDPVKEYLDQCYTTYGDATKSLLDDAASRYLHTQEEIYNVYLRKTLVAAVARTFDPGCKFDTALVFQSGQGFGKSTFWRILGGQWFDDTVGGFDKDEQQKLHHFWIEEFGEIDKIQSKHDVSIVKAFLSRQADTFRPPFGRNTKKFPRKFIIVGSTNKQEILLDPTGDRRFWIIPLTEVIDNDAVRKERDQLWAGAVALYKAGESIYLPKELETVRAEMNLQFRMEDPWETAIVDYVADKQVVTTCDILLNVLQIPLERQDRRNLMRVADQLRSLGWTKKHTRNGKIWEAPPKVVTVLTEAQKQDKVIISSGDHLDKEVVTNNPLGSQEEDFFSRRDPVTTETTFFSSSKVSFFDQNDRLAGLDRLKVGDKVRIYNMNEAFKRFPKLDLHTLDVLYDVVSINGDQVGIKGKCRLTVPKDWLVIPVWEVAV